MSVEQAVCARREAVWPNTLPTLATQRLELRAMADDDLQALFRIYGDADGMGYANDDTFTRASDVVPMLASVERQLMQGRSLEWAVVERSGTQLNGAQLIGTCGLHSFDTAMARAEVGCLFARPVWGQGYAHEAVTAMIGYARRALCLQRLRADIDAANTRSLALFGRLGFEPIGARLHEFELWPDENGVKTG